jgi:NADPH-dependent 2,4-dienoyl-CoA reductase/sulfur reductase-like enzyme
MSAGETVIVGGGLVAQRFIETYRREGGEDRITVISDEPIRPYDRPPLSKAALKDQAAETFFRDLSWYAENSVDLILGDAAVRLDAEGHEVELSSGRLVPWQRLLIATGSRARTIPGFDSWPNSHVLRTAADSQRLGSAITEGTRVAIVGAGFIGLEVASTALSVGAKPIVIEAEPIPLRGLLGEDLGGWLVDWHLGEGVDVITGTGVSEVTGNERAESRFLADGSEIHFDELLIAVGAAPNVEWLEGSGLEIDGGILCAEDGSTSIEGIWAAGDCASPWRSSAERHVRAEHWEAAGAQARAAARSMLALPHLEAPMSSFWSDMHGVRIQHLGHPADADSVEIDGTPESLDFEVVWRSEGRAVAALAVGRPRSIPALRKMFSEQPPSPTGGN